MMFQDGLINTDSASLTVDAETYDCLVERFITRLTNTPDAIAAQRHGAELTNQELNPVRLREGFIGEYKPSDTMHHY